MAISIDYFEFHIYIEIFSLDRLTQFFKLSVVSEKNFYLKSLWNHYGTVDSDASAGLICVTMEIFVCATIAVVREDSEEDGAIYRQGQIS